MDRGPFGQGASRIRRMRVSLRLAITEPPTAALTHPCSQTQVQFHSSHSLSLPRFLCLLQLDSRFLIQPDSISWKLLVHSGENPFNCTQCEFSCKQATNLKTHMRTHSGEKPFKCDQCNYSTTQAGTLKIHKRKHTGEQPFVCDRCDYSSKQHAGLRMHVMKNHRAEPNVRTENK